MDNNKKAVITKKIEKTMASLKRNNMQAFYAEDKKQAADIAMSLIHESDSIRCGGSMSLEEAGIISRLRAGSYNFLYQNTPGLTPEQVREIHVSAFTADAYLTSSNAITEKGELYNVDGNSNRVAAMVYGPKRVIVVAGYNKLVANVEEAAERVKAIAGPANSTRLSRNTPCVPSGRCMDCRSEDRICCNYVVMAMQRHKDRVKVVIVGEELGY